jgi:hypothetical protein
MTNTLDTWLKHEASRPLALQDERLRAELGYLLALAAGVQPADMERLRQLYAARYGAGKELA